MSCGFRPALPLTGGSDPGVYVRGFMSANPDILQDISQAASPRTCASHGVSIYDVMFMTVVMTWVLLQVHNTHVFFHKTRKTHISQT